MNNTHDEDLIDSSENEGDIENVYNLSQKNYYIIHIMMLIVK